jgi:hypothetical protein
MPSCPPVEDKEYEVECRVEIDTTVTVSAKDEDDAMAKAEAVPIDKHDWLEERIDGRKATRA